LLPLELKDVCIFGVVKDDVSIVQKYISGYQLNYPVLICGQDDGTLNKGYGVQVVSTTMLIDQGGNVLKFYEGLMNEEQVDEIMIEIRRV
jgi:peroxiredoxin